MTQHTPADQPSPTQDELVARLKEQAKQQKAMQAAEERERKQRQKEQQKERNRRQKRKASPEQIAKLMDEVRELHRERREEDPTFSQVRLIKVLDPRITWRPLIFILELFKPFLYPLQRFVAVDKAAWYAGAAWTVGGHRLFLDTEDDTVYMTLYLEWGYRLDRYPRILTSLTEPIIENLLEEVQKERRYIAEAREFKARQRAYEQDRLEFERKMREFVKRERRFDGQDN